MGFKEGESVIVERGAWAKKQDPWKSLHWNLIPVPISGTIGDPIRWVPTHRTSKKFIFIKVIVDLEYDQLGMLVYPKEKIHRASELEKGVIKELI